MRLLGSGIEEDSDHVRLGYLLLQGHPCFDVSAPPVFEHVSRNAATLTSE